MMMNLPCLMASCANFLRPICSYTECRLSFQTGSCPTERTTASYSSCLFWLLLTFLCCRDSFQWTPPLLYQLVLCMFFGTTSLKKGYKKRRCISTSFEFYFHYLSDSYVCAKKAVQVGIMESRALFQVWEEPSNFMRIKVGVGEKPQGWRIWQTMCLAVFPGTIGPIDNLASFNYSCCYL